MSEPTGNNYRWKVTCSYDGTGFDGWQSQISGNAVQDHFERVLADILGRVCRIHGASRTDAGVHARGQVFHFDAAWRHGAEALSRAMTASLPEEIQIRQVEQATGEFHARFNSVGKRYVYRFEFGTPDPMERLFVYTVRQKPVSVGGMRAAASCLVGERDFSALASNIDRREKRVKNVWRVDFLERGASRYDMVVEGNGFLYRMVRRMAGAILQVGLGRFTLAQLENILQQREPVAAIPTAPAAGLCLEEVFYAESDITPPRPQP